MLNEFRIGTLLGVAATLVLASSVSADRVKLKDGRVIEGTVIPQGSGYWVRSSDGQTYKLTKEEVVSIDKGAAAPAAGTPAAGTTPASPGAAPKIAVNFNVTKSRCTVVDSALAAVTLWQQFLDNAPENSPDLPAAREEHAKWKALADSSAEKIKGKWIGGDERKAILAKATALQKEADELIEQQQTLQAVKKLEEAAAVYPNSFESNFQLAYIYMIQHDEKKAAEWFAKASAIRPDAPEVLANQGLLHCVKRRYDVGIPLMTKALQKGDRREIVHNLITAISSAPEVLRRRADIKEAEGAARLLAGKYNLSGPGDSYLIVPLMKENRGGRGGAEHEAMWSGTGFIVAADGLILTNRHVVEGAKTLMVILKGAGPGGSDLQRSGEVVVIDDQQDLALVRIKVDAKQTLTVMQLAPTDAPGDGAECTVIGFPMIDRLGAAVKITRGIVSSAAKQANGPDIMVDAKVNPGNSGGPILDRYGNVMAIVSMKTVASRLEDSYGLGISAGMVRRFLAKNSVTLKPGTTDGKTLSAEEIAAKAKPSTVCILGTK
ncbi:trypsin-like peptidase domain-containing protein [Humisphaera borealis]|uniref:Trypsin-like peptidase domain-containing protein n=1 Tax=Humisphaera borealis TaxID=2807512 RepID=A0A7M2X399_9BACT|nr:trypsin-like peptidase domain-containing protein [Humisphaera borealis]QOV92154.1 trypsin-like peptidase domain-containing protein [Humisphaera borealis]